MIDKRTLLVVVVAAQPPDYHVERSIEVQAPAEVAWQQLSDFNTRKAWSPWQKMDPMQRTTVTGLPASIGHTNTWDGEKTGRGSQTITEVDKPRQLTMELVMLKPMADEAVTGFEIAEAGSASKVTWYIDGKNSFVKKLFALVMGMEGMLGDMFDQGLADLRPIVEAKARGQAMVAKEDVQ